MQVSGGKVWGMATMKFMPPGEGRVYPTGDGTSGGTLEGPVGAVHKNLTVHVTLTAPLPLLHIP